MTLTANEKAAITKGDFDISSFYGVDEARQKVYYQSFKKAFNQKHVYEADLKGKNKRILTKAAGTNRAQFSSTFDYYVNTHSTIKDPNSYTVYKNEGTKVRVIEDNARIKQIQKIIMCNPWSSFLLKLQKKLN